MVLKIPISITEAHLFQDALAVTKRTGLQDTDIRRMLATQCHRVTTPGVSAAIRITMRLKIHVAEVTHITLRHAARITLRPSITIRHILRAVVFLHPVAIPGPGVSPLKVALVRKEVSQRREESQDLLEFLHSLGTRLEEGSLRREEFLLQEASPLKGRIPQHQVIQRQEDIQPREVIPHRAATRHLPAIPHQVDTDIKF